MAQVRSWAGLDVHARSVLAVTMDAASGELRSRRLPGDTGKVVEFCGSLPGPTRVAYEAGPTGYGLARALSAAGVGCVVAAPGKIERPSSDRVKTDERDASRLLRLLMIDALHPVRIPSPGEEALRDLVRAREDVRGDLMSARQRLSKLLCATTCSMRTPPAPGRSVTARGCARRTSVAARRSPCWITSARSTPSSPAESSLSARSAS
jgi:transposase